MLAMAPYISSALRLICDGQGRKKGAAEGVMAAAVTEMPIAPLEEKGRVGNGHARATGEAK